MASLAAEALLTALERNWDMVDRALEGLDDASLARCPSGDCNSIAWILWHMNRVWDVLLHLRLEDRPTVWVQDRWCRKFGMAEDPEERGTGWTAQQVEKWQPPSREALLGYHEAMKNRIREYLSSLGDADLEREVVVPPRQESRSVAAELGQRTWDIIAHGGQIAYLRGMYRGMGWYPA